jgi:hypothetical protein
MIFNEKRRRQYKQSLQKLPGKIASLRLLANAALHTNGEDCIAFRIDGGLGDYIIAARFIRDFMAEFEQEEFDIFCKKPAIAKWVFQNSARCRSILDAKVDTPMIRRLYLAKVDCLTYLEIPHVKESHTRLEALASTVQSAKKRLRHITSQYPHLDGYLGRYATLKGQNRYTFVGSMAGVAYGGDELELPYDATVLDRLRLRERGFLTISNGYDLNAVQYAPSSFGSTKVYPHFAELVSLLKARFPNVPIVQIGNESSTKLAGVDIDLIGRTTLNEAAGLLRGSRLHIDNEGGLVHVARSFGTPCCVIFGPTDPDYFGYPDNINIRPRQCGNCWWMEPTWMTKCVRGDSLPSCMFDQPAQGVFERIAEHLTQTLKVAPDIRSASKGRS